MRSSKRHHDEGQTALDDALDALTEWQDEVRSLSERHGERVLRKLSAAAKSAGWPDTLVDANREQIQLTAKAQAEALDQIISAWRQQVRSGAMQSAVGASHAVPGQSHFTAMAVNPAQFWMQVAAGWQKGWLNAMQSWGNGSMNGRR